MPSFPTSTSKVIGGILTRGDPSPIISTSTMREDIARSPVDNAVINVDVPDKHDYAANLEVEVMWRHAGDVNRLEKFNRGNIVDIIRIGFDDGVCAVQGVRPCG